MSPVVELLRELSAVLRERGVSWYLFGAQAVVLYGLPRLTADVDVTVRIARGEVMPLVASLREAGFALRVADVDDFLSRTQVLPFLHVSSGLPLDLVVAGSGLEEEFLRGAKELDLEGVRVPVIRPEDLVVAKILAGRPKDLADVRGILRVQLDAIDLARIREVLLLLEEALDQSDLVSAFELVSTSSAQLPSAR